jgi:hypothetical protein
MNEKMYRAKSQQPLAPPVFTQGSSSNSHLTIRYLSNISLAPGVVKLITFSGVLDEGSVKSASDFSYSAPSYAGNGYRIIGDAGGIPIFYFTLAASTLIE